MIYDYRCKCGNEEEVIKSATRIEDPERCSECGNVMERQFSFGGHVTMGTFAEGFYPAFGKHLNSKKELRTELSRYKHETGTELVEVGNERAAFNKIKPQRKEVDKAEVIKELKHRMKHGRSND